MRLHYQVGEHLVGTGHNRLHSLVGLARQSVFGGHCLYLDRDSQAKLHPSTGVAHRYPRKDRWPRDQRTATLLIRSTELSTF